MSVHVLTVLKSFSMPFLLCSLLPCSYMLYYHALILLYKTAAGRGLALQCSSYVTVTKLLRFLVINYIIIEICVLYCTSYYIWYTHAELSLSVFSRLCSLSQSSIPFLEHSITTKRLLKHCYVAGRNYRRNKTKQISSACSGVARILGRAGLKSVQQGQSRRCITWNFTSFPQQSACALDDPAHISIEWHHSSNSTVQNRLSEIDCRIDWKITVIQAELELMEHKRGGL